MYAALHTHDEYSLLDGAGTAAQHVAAARDAGVIALASTNHGTLAGTLHHMRACREGDVMPIVGCELYYRPNRKVQGQRDWLSVYYHLTVHAKNEHGWRNLMALVSEAHRSGFYGRACVDLELLERYHEDLVCLTGCLGGVLCKSIVNDDDRGAENWLRQLKRIFGDDLFVEIMPHDIDDQRKANIEVVRLANKHGIPIVATIDAHYPTKDWADVQDTLLMIATNQSVKKREKKREEGEDVYEFGTKEFFHQTAQEIRENFFRHHPAIDRNTVDESIRNTLVAAGRTIPFLVDRNEKMPSISFPGDESNSAMLRRLALEGLVRRGYGPGHPQHRAYLEKVNFELATFEEHEVVDYILMVWDIVQWAKSDRPVPKRKGGKLVYEGIKKQPIMVGPGRGSAAGSIVSWAIGLTNVNPHNYRLLFERFLNPNRRGLPDVDIDFPPDRVDEVEDYIKCVPTDSQILTRDGWKRHDQVAVGDETIGYDPVTRRSTWTKITAVHAGMRDEVMRYGNAKWDVRTTSGHRWWSDSLRRRMQGGISRYDVEPQFVKAGSFHRLDRLRLAAKVDAPGTLKISSVEAAVIGWIMGDGSINGWDHEQACVRARIYQSKHLGVQCLRDLLATVPHTVSVRDVEHCSINPSTETTYLPMHTFRLQSDWVRDVLQRARLEEGAERFVMGLSSAARAAWLRAIGQAEGSARRAGEVGGERIYQKCGEILDAIVLATYMEGSRPSVSSNPGATGNEDHKVVTFCKEHVATQYFAEPVSQGEQDVWCVSTELGTWTMRQDGKVMLTGNSVHGKGNVVDIIAHSTFGPRAALTDVGRVLSIPYDHVKAATKTIDEDDRSPLPELYKVNPAVARLADQYPDMWRLACMVQGMVARKSEHAGGVLILPGPVEEYIPVERTGGQKGKLLSAFGERSGKGNALISDYGYTKVDVLRVAELTKQQHAVDLVRQRTGLSVDLDELEIHDDPYKADPQVMQGFKDGKLVGIFQLSSTAAKLTRQIKPDNILELAAINALIRPGPRNAGSDQRFHRRKHGKDALALMDTTVPMGVLEPFLDYTFGELVFQEQLIEVVHHLGGLTRAEADIFRKIASKLYRDPDYARAVMGEWEVPIKEGFRRAGLDESVIEIIWKNLLSFSDYSFNLAHAAGYAVLAYRDMWLKTYYPREFYAAFLSKGLSQITKKKVIQKQEAVREARAMGLKIMPPDVNESGRDYTVVDGGIRLGLEAIKHIGPASATAIEELRPFADYQDFERRVQPRQCNITGKAALIMAGAFDRWSMRNDFTEEHIDELERNLLGMSLTSVYSIQQYAEYLDFETKFWTEDEIEAAAEQTRVAVVGEVTRISEKIDRKGHDYAFVDLAYGSNTYSCTVFSYIWAEFEELIKSRRPLLITGVKNTWEGKVGIKVEALPPDANGQWTPPIMDVSDYVDLIGEQAEDLAGDSVYPEDLQEVIEPDPNAISGAFAAALSR